MPNSKFLILERERHDLGAGRRAEKAAAAGGHDHVLPAVLAEEGHRHGVRARRKLGLPELLAALGFERAEAAIDRRADEEHTAGGHDAAADVGRAGPVKSLRLQ